MNRIQKPVPICFYTRFALMKIMGEGQDDRKKAWKNILKPDRWKIVVFIIFLVVMVFIPLYPTHTDEYNTRLYYWDPLPTLDYTASHTTFQPLFLVIKEDYDWTMQETVLGGMRPGDYSIVYTHSYKANPAFLILYIPYAMLTYLFACYLTELYRWSRKGKGNNEPDVHLRTPPKGV